MADKHLFPQTIVNWQSWYVARIRPHVEYVDECEPTRVDSENGNYEVFECREEWLEVLRSLLEKGKKIIILFILYCTRGQNWANQVSGRQILQSKGFLLIVDVYIIEMTALQDLKIGKIGKTLLVKIIRHLLK